MTTQSTARNYRFNNDWFSNGPRKNFEKHVVGLPVNSYLEIGVCEGQSMAWILENLRPKRAVGVDIWKGKRKKHDSEMRTCRRNAFRNLRPWLSDGTLELVEQPSVKYLANCEEQFDLIYIDGDHSGPGALTDMLLAYPRLAKNIRKWFVDDHEWKAGGMMVIDDLNRTWNRWPEVKIAQMQFELITHGKMRRAWMEARQCGYVRLR